MSAAWIKTSRFALFLLNRFVMNEKSYSWREQRRGVDDWVVIGGFEKNMKEEGEKPMEKCFACHLIIFPIGLVYILWVVTPRDMVEDAV